MCFMEYFSKQYFVQKKKKKGKNWHICFVYPAFCHLQLLDHQVWSVFWDIPIHLHGLFSIFPSSKLQLLCLSVLSVPVEQPAFRVRIFPKILELIESGGFGRGLAVCLHLTIPTLELVNQEKVFFWRWWGGQMTGDQRGRLPFILIGIISLVIFSHIQRLNSSLSNCNLFLLLHPFLSTLSIVSRTHFVLSWLIVE